ncbi:MAG: DMT family transporter [Bacteroidales bacterium]|nr:DMT family transporter [Bacteroidales bacterium]
MNKNKKLILVYCLLTISMILWGTSFVWSKIGLTYYNSITVVFFRLLVSTIVMIPVLIVTKKFRFPTKKHLPLFLLLALFEPFLYFIGETTGLSYVEPSMASVIISVIPLFTPFVAFYFLKEKITILNVLGITISISGIVVLVFGKDMSLQISMIGLGLLFLAVIAANGYSVMIKKIPDQYSILNIIFWQNILGMLYFAPLLLIFSRKDLFVTGFVEEAFWAIVSLGFFASTIAFLFFMYGLKFMSITKVNVFTNVIPIFTIIVSYLFLGEEIGSRKILGIFIVIIGVVVSQLKYRLFNRKRLVASK